MKRRAVRQIGTVSVVALAATFGVATSACDPAATTPPVVENVSYVTNVYTQPQTAAAAPSSSPDLVVEAPTRPVGIPACDAFFAETESCVRNLTNDAAALSRFEGRVQAGRAEAERAERSGDEGQIAHAAAACEAAVDAYRLAPCS